MIETNQVMKLTVLLPLHKSKGFLERWLNHVNGFSLPVSVILLPKSNEDKAHAEKTIPFFKNGVISYTVLYLEDSLPLLERVTRAIERVQTEFVTMASDDDFIDLDNLIRLCEGLDQNSEFVGARGLTVNFSTIGRWGQRVGWANSRRVHFRLRLDELAMQSPSPEARIKEFLENAEVYDLWTLWYSTYRTLVFKQVVRQIASAKVKDGFEWELLLNIGLLNSGGVTVFPLITYARQNGTSRYTSTMNRKGTVEERFNSAGGQSRLEQFLHRNVDTISAEQTENLCTTARTLIQKVSKSKKKRLTLPSLLPRAIFAIYFNMRALPLSEASSKGRWSAALGLAGHNYVVSMRRFVMAVSAGAPSLVLFELDRSRFNHEKGQSWTTQ